jgi:hypothetical protein
VKALLINVTWANASRIRLPFEQRNQVGKKAAGK